MIATNTIEKKTTNYLDFDFILEKTFERLQLRSDDLLKDIALSADLRSNLKTLITKALNFTNIEDFKNLEWRFVASRLLLFSTYLKACENRGFDSNNFTPYQNYYDFVSEIVQNNLYDSRILDFYTKEEINEIAKEINPEYDFSFDYAGMNLLVERYLIKRNSKAFELPQELFLSISLLLAIPEKKENRLEMVKKFYHAIAGRKISLATPIVLNLRKPNGNLSSCFPKGQRVLTNKGFKNIEDVIIGDKVVTENNTVQKVLNTNIKEFSGDLVSLNIRGLGKNVLNGTDNHLVYTIKKESISCIRGETKTFSNCLSNNGSYKRCYKRERYYSKDCNNLNKDFDNLIEWVELKDLKTGDFLGISFPNYINNIKQINLEEYLGSDFDNLVVKDDSKLYVENMSKRRKKTQYNLQIKPVNNYINIDSNFMRFIGYYLAEGYINSDDAIVFTFNTKEVKYVEDIEKITEKVFGLKTFSHKNKDNSTRVSIHSIILSRLILKLVGTHFNKKYLNDIILYADPEIQKDLLVGVFRGDGCSSNSNLILSLSNRNLIEQLYIICLRNKLSPVITHSTKLRKLATTLVSTLSLNYNKDPEFINYVDKNIHSLKSKVNDKKLGSFWYKDNYFLEVLKKDIQLVESLPVYDLEVENIHSFNVSFVTVHNCFIGAMDDSLDSIYYTLEQVAQISKNAGGCGVNISRVRASGSNIRDVKKASSGVMPWVKLINDTGVAVNQQGARAGAITVALDIWHLDIEDFLQSQTENGDLRKKAFDIFPQIVIPDLFMQRVENNDTWTLFDPNEVKMRFGINLAELYGQEFNEKYEFLEKQDQIELKQVIKAKDLFKDFLKIVVETGMPYVTFKDTINKYNPNKHAGMIGNANLCTESFSNFKPSNVTNKSIKNDFSQVTKEADAGELHTCNLISLNLSLMDTDQEVDYYTRLNVRILDNTIDISTAPVLEAMKHNNEYRILGIGAMGLADWLVKRKKTYTNGLASISELFEKIAYAGISESIDLATERGIYPKYEGSDWSKGIIMGKDSEWFNTNETALGKEAWMELIKKLTSNGIRNGGLFAIAPNTSTSLLMGSTASILPVFNKFFIDKASKGSVPVCPPFMSQETFWYYQENKNLDQQVVITNIAEIQKWTDQGISMELYLNLNLGLRAKDIYNLYMQAWKKECKTVYYIRSIALKTTKEECISCAN